MLKLGIRVFVHDTYSSHVWSGVVVHSDIADRVAVELDSGGRMSCPIRNVSVSA